MAEIPRIYEFNLDVESSTPKALNHQTIANIVDGQGKYICQTRCPSDFGMIDIILEPYQGATHFLLEWKIKEELIPAKFIPGVIHGINLAASNHPSGLIINLKIQVVGGANHPVDSRIRSYITATILAFNDAISKTTLIGCE
jgi:hypothetical protein